MTQEPVKCIAPWRALCIKADGNVVPDIHFKESLGNIHKQSLIDILKNPRLKTLREAKKLGHFDEKCRNCQLKEESGGRSRRTFFYDVLFEHIETRDFLIDEEPDIYFLELNTSNTCNLKCRMCSGLISSAWIRDEQSFAGTPVQNLRPRFGNYQLGKEGIDKLLGNPEIFRNLKFLALRGGEPLYEEMNLYLFEKLDELGLTKQIHLDISTNGTIISEKVQKALDRFQSIELYLSMEGIGPIYQYIRGGKRFDTNQIEEAIKNFQAIPQLNLVFTYTSMVYNIGEINNFWHWYESVRKSGDEISLSNIVTNPDYLSFHILPDELKETFFDEIDNGPIPKGPYDTGKRITGDVGIEAILRGLQNKAFYDEEKIQQLRKEFKMFNQHLDANRKMNLKEYIPQLAPFYDSISI